MGKELTKKQVEEIATRNIKAGLVLLVAAPLLLGILGYIAGGVLHGIGCAICGGCSGSNIEKLQLLGAVIGAFAGLYFWADAKAFDS